MKYQDRKRAEGFGKFALQYDKTRPSYPKSLIKLLSENGVGNALDIGCGTGQVAILLKNAEWNVLAIEPDDRMAKIAHSKGIEIIVSTFEQWVPTSKSFDLITSGTSWHWINPDIGYDKAASLLKSGGQLAIFRNFYNYEHDVSDIIKKTIKEYAPQLLNECVSLGIGDYNRTDPIRKEFETRYDLFSNIEIKIFKHKRTVSIDTWTEELTTHSPIYQLDEKLSYKLLRALKHNLFPLLGNTVSIFHDTYCLLAKKH